MAELSELTLGSRWIDEDGDVQTILAVKGEMVTSAWQDNDDQWQVQTFAWVWREFTPYVEQAKCPDFERFLVWDGKLQKSDGFSLTDNYIAMRGDFVFLAGVRDGEPFIKQVKP